MDKKFLKDTLDEAAGRINVKDFIADDPVQFPHRFRRQDDIEIVSVLISHISWGRRSMILRDSERMLALMGDSPADFVRDGDFSHIDPSGNIHRTFFGSDLIYFLKGLNRIYSRFQTLESFAAEKRINERDLPAWTLAAELNREMELANGNCPKSIRCLPGNLDSTALKRLNMALRWLVRDDGIVDLGIWKVLKPNQLYIPLDVHVGNVSRSLGLIDRKGNDRKTVVELTSRLAEFDPADPVRYDFALFGLGVSGEA